MDSLSWLQNSPVGVWVAESVWGYPIVLSLHAVGMGLVVGAAVMLDLRILGYARDIPLRSLDRLFTVAWCAFALNAVTGLALFTGDPAHFFYHPAFRTKLCLIALGLASLWLLGRTVRSANSSGAERRELSRADRILAVASLAFWFGAIISGRLIAYIKMA